MTKPCVRFNRLASLLCCLALGLSSAPTVTASQLDPDELINLELEQADLVETLKSFAQISGSYLDIEPSVRGKVTLSLEAVSWTDAIDQICTEHQLNCEISSGESSVVRVRSAAAGAGATSIPGYVEAISLALKSADLRQTLQAFAVITQRDVVIDDGVSGTVTINIGAAPWSVILEEICNLAGCEIEWGQTLHIRSVNPPNKAKRANLSLADASVEAAAETLVQMPIFGSLGRPEVQLAEDLTGTVSLELDDVNWLEAMNQLCEAADCVWKLTYGDPTRIDIKPRDRSPERQVELPHQPMPLNEAIHLLADLLGLEVDLRQGLDHLTEVRFPKSPAIWHDAAKDICKQAGCWPVVEDKKMTVSPRVKPLADRPTAGAPDRRVAVRFQSPTASLPTVGAVRFNWTSPIHTLESSAVDSSDQDRWMARLSWIPFGPEQHWVAPTMIHCSANGNTVDLLAPFAVPQDDPQSRHWRGSMVELSSLDDEAPILAKTRHGKECAGTSTKNYVEATFHRAGGRGTISTLDLHARIGNYLLVTPPGGKKRPTPMAALMALGPDTSGQQRVALLRPTADGATVDIEQLEVPPSGIVAATLKAPDGSEYELAMRFVTKE